MKASCFVLRFALLIGALATSALFAADPVTLRSVSGVTVRFDETDTGWRWTGLQSPGASDDGWPIEDIDPEIASLEAEETLTAGWTLIDAASDKVVFEQAAPVTGLAVRRTYSFGAASNVLRIETAVRSVAGAKVLAKVGLLDVHVAGESFRETGTAPASFPVFGQALFAGIEHVSGEAGVIGDLADRVRLQQRPRTSLDEDWQPIATAVVGWASGEATSGVGDTRMREGFLQYLDTVRIKPGRIVLHTDTWWTVPLPLTEKNVLDNIETLHAAFADRTGMFFDSYCVDSGWSNPQTFWQMNTANLPNELRVIDEKLADYGTKMGLWMSPGSGYPDSLSNSWLKSQGYEMLPFTDKLPEVPCFALGTRYQREFKERIVSYAQQYGLGHVILDFMPQRCDVDGHGHPIGPDSRYAIDAGLADVLDSLRAVNPEIVLEPMVCGYPPSPWWLMKSMFVLGPAGDDLPYGRGPCPEWMESLVTARDAAYRAGQEAWLMPTQALETFDIIAVTPGEIQNMAVMAIGRGRWFLSTYFKPELMQLEDWDFFAALVRWARENKQYLGNAWQFGGHPETREAYGYVFRNPGKDLYCVRNPWIVPREIVLPASPAATESYEVRMIYPRRQTVGRIAPGSEGLKLTVGPYETMFFDTIPATDDTPVANDAVPTPLTIVAGAPHYSPRSPSRVPNELVGFRWDWEGVVTAPEDAAAELCLLVEGPPEVSGTLGKIFLNGREVTPQRSQSAGQFGAAIDASPENWTWLTVPLPPGETSVEINLTLVAAEASVGVFARGSVAAPNDAAPETGAVFPTYHANRRPWGQTLTPLQRFFTDDSDPAVDGP